MIGRETIIRWLDLAICFVSTVTFFMHRESDTTEGPTHICIYIVYLHTHIDIYIYIYIYT